MRFGEGAVEVVNVAHVLFVGLTGDVEEPVAICLDGLVTWVAEWGGFTLTA